MLLCVRDPRASPRQAPSLQRQFSQHGRESDTTRVSHFLPTSRRIVQFSNGKVHSLYFTAQRAFVRFPPVVAPSDSDCQLLQCLACGGLNSRREAGLDTLQKTCWRLDTLRRRLADSNAPRLP